MSENNEVFTAQTRQTRTSLNISASTLLVFSLWGKSDPDMHFGVSPFKISSETFPAILFAATMYFFISFLISVAHDLKKHQNILSFGQIKRHLVLALSNFKDDSLNFKTLRERLDSQLSELSTFASRLNVEGFTRAVTEPTTPSLHALQDMINPVEQFRHRFLNKDFEKVTMPLVKHCEQAIGAASGEIEEIQRLIANEEWKFTPYERAKVVGLETLFPLVFSVLSLVISPTVYLHVRGMPVSINIADERPCEPPYLCGLARSKGVLS